MRAPRRGGRRAAAARGAAVYAGGGRRPRRPPPAATEALSHAEARGPSCVAARRSSSASSSPSGVYRPSPAVRPAASTLAGRFRQLGEERLPPRSDRLHPVVLRRLEGGGAAAPAQVVVLDELEHGGREGVHLAGRDEQPIAVVVQKLGRPRRTVEADDGHALAHRLEEGDRKALEPRAQHEDRRFRHLSGEVLGAGELDHVGKPFLFDLPLEFLPEVPSPADPQPPVRMRPDDVAERGNQHVESLLASQPPRRQDRPRLEVGRRAADLGGVGDADERDIPVEELLVLVLVLVGEHRDGAELPVAPSDRAPEGTRVVAQVHVLLADRDQPGRREVRGDQVEARTRPDEEALLPPQLAHELKVDPEVADARRAVGGVNEHARTTRQEPTHEAEPLRRRAGSLIVERGHLHARWELEERLVHATHDAQDLDVVRAGEMGREVVGGADRAPDAPRAPEQDEDPASAVAGLLRPRLAARIPTERHARRAPGRLPGVAEQEAWYASNPRRGYGIVVLKVASIGGRRTGAADTLQAGPRGPGPREGG